MSTSLLSCSATDSLVPLSLLFLLLFLVPPSSLITSVCSPPSSVHHSIPSSAVSSKEKLLNSCTAPSWADLVDQDLDSHLMDSLPSSHSSHPMDHDYTSPTISIKPDLQARLNAYWAHSLLRNTMKGRKIPRTLIDDISYSTGM